MTSAVVSEPEAGATAPAPRRRRKVWLVAGTAVFLAAALAFGLLRHSGEGRPPPSFASLAEHPDNTLHGTVAYAVGDCVHIVAAAGQPSKELLCTGPSSQTPEQAERDGKEVGLQLVWRPDGRLEVTMVRMEVGKQTHGQPPRFNAEWQKVVDVRTGGVEDVPSDALPPVPNLTSRPTVSPDGRRVTWTGKSLSGRAKVMLTDAHGTRTLLSAQGPGEYGYGIAEAFWAPNWQWIAADDGRILVITPGDPALTRILVAADRGGAGISTFPTIAVTAEDILTSSS